MSGQLSQRLQRRERLKLHRNYTATLAGGKVYRSSFMLYWRVNGMDTSRLGLIVNKRCGMAVVRNKIKRRLREIFRKNKSKIPIGIDIIWRTRPNIVGIGYAETEETFLDAIGEIRAQLDTTAGNRSV